MRERARMRMCVSERACVPVCVCVRACGVLGPEVVSPWPGDGAAHHPTKVSCVPVRACSRVCVRAS